MNGINRVSQKVVCVHEFEMFDAQGRAYPGPMPIADKIYTVAGFIDNTGLLESIPGSDPDDLIPGIELMEIPSPKQRGGNRRLGWPLIGFRPALDRKTDISALTEASNRTDLLTPDDRLAEIMRPFEVAR